MQTSIRAAKVWHCVHELLGGDGDIEAWFNFTVKRYHIYAALCFVLIDASSHRYCCESQLASGQKDDSSMETTGGRSVERWKVNCLIQHEGCPFSASMEIRSSVRERERKRSNVPIPVWRLTWSGQEEVVYTLIKLARVQCRCEWRGGNDRVLR